MTTSGLTAQKGTGVPTGPIPPPVMVRPDSPLKGTGAGVSTPSFPLPGQSPETRAVEPVRTTLTRASSLESRLRDHVQTTLELATNAAALRKNAEVRVIVSLIVEIEFIFVVFTALKLGARSVHSVGVAPEAPAGCCQAVGVSRLASSYSL